jgi:hypothetical protein
MQAVDRFDQLVKLFSLAMRHNMKKYYHKLTLSLMDTAMVNGWVHFDLVNGAKGPRNARVNFVETCAKEFITTDWEMVLQKNGGTASRNSGAGDLITMMGVTKKNNDDIVASGDDFGGGSSILVATCVPVSLGAGEGQYRVPASKNAKNNEDMFKAPTKDGKACMVCKFEERGAARGKKVSACLTHGIRACTVVQPSRQSGKPLMKEGTEETVTDWSWICPEDITCWDKAHLWHLPRGLWSSPVMPGDRINRVFYAANTRVTSELYKKKMAALGRSQSKRGGTRKRKPQQKEADSKRRAKKTEDDEFSSSDEDEE